MEGHEETTPPFDPAAADSSPVPAAAEETSSVPAADLEDRLDELEAAVERLTGRLDHLGQGGETAGDALRIAHYGVACARELSAGISRATGTLIPLPPAPAPAQALGDGATPAGVETMDGVAGIT